MSVSFEKKYDTQVLSFFLKKKKKLLSFCALFWLPMALTQTLFLRGALNVSVVGPQTCVGKRRERP